MQWVSFRMTLDIRLSAMVCDGSVLWKCKRVSYPTQGEVTMPLAVCRRPANLSWLGWPPAEAKQTLSTNEIARRGQLRASPHWTLCWEVRTHIQDPPEEMKPSSTSTRSDVYLTYLPPHQTSSWQCACCTFFCCQNHSLFSMFNTKLPLRISVY